jgi:hypothetical protein
MFSAPMSMHHLCLGEVNTNKQEVWGEVEVIISPAFDRAWALQNPNTIAGKGGIFMAISPKIVKYH